jgi:hypothetical protein
MTRTRMNFDWKGSRPASTGWSHCRRMAAPAVLAVICLALPMGAGAAEGNCSNATLKGEYGALVQGVRGISPPDAPLVTEMFVGIALRNFDGNGGFIEEAASQHGAITGLQGGVGANATAGIFGTYHVNPDCTGTSTLVLPAPFPTIVSDFVIVDHGRGIKEIVTSPAANIVTAVYTRK